MSYQVCKIPYCTVDEWAKRWRCMANYVCCHGNSLGCVVNPDRVVLNHQDGHPEPADLNPTFLIQKSIKFVQCRCSPNMRTLKLKFW